MLLAAAAHAEGVPLFSTRGTSLGIGPNFEWVGPADGRGGDLERQWTVGLYGAKVLFDGEDTATGFGSTALVGSVAYGVDNEDLRWTLGARWRLWNRR